MGFTSLNHHLDLAWLVEAYNRTRKDAAPGVDGRTAEDYGRSLVENLRSLLDRAKSGSYRAPPVRRVRDGVLLRLIDKWLKAGVLDGGELTYPEAGTPQGGVISPLLANVYLHDVLDEWFEREGKPRLKGRAFLVRYADDFVLGFACEEDARRVLDVLPKRFGKYGLTIHPDETRLLPFHRPARVPSPPAGGSGPRSESFDFLGFTHFGSRSKRGLWVVKRKTAGSRFHRALRSIGEWCRLNRPLPLGVQHRALWQKLCGHFRYYGGVIGNSRSLWCFRQRVPMLWQKWLARRGGRGSWSWARMQSVLRRFVLPTPPGWAPPCVVNL